MGVWRYYGGIRPRAWYSSPASFYIFISCLELALNRYNGVFAEMILTKAVNYGLRAVINIAKTSHNRPVSIRSIATQEKVSFDFLEQIFSKLRKAGIVKSTHGPGGGFELSMAPGEISVQDILVALGETRELTPCMLSGKTPCDRAELCAAHEIWTGLQGAMENYLTKVTLKDILANEETIFAKLEASHDFSI